MAERGWGRGDACAFLPLAICDCQNEVEFVCFFVSKNAFACGFGTLSFVNSFLLIY